MPLAPPFPDSFVWGAGTSAYQVEGSPLADGAGASIWHRFAHMPGMTRNGETGDIACDHYRRWREDIALMKDLGLQSYRFSFAWGRVLPAGRGALNPAGLGFYDQLVDGLLEAGIQPMATLYHWDLPAALDDRGGWLNPDSAGWFADYADLMFRCFDDRIDLWLTLNEPWVVMNDGYLLGSLAPGHRNIAEAARVGHHLLLAHAQAVRAYRATGRHRIGLAVNLEPKYPATPSPADAAACARAHAWINGYFLDPVLLGRYPEELPSIYNGSWPSWPASDLALISEPIDFLGINYYSRRVVTASSDFPQHATVVPQTAAAHTEMGWEVFPQGLRDILAWVRERYGNPPVIITENGAAFADTEDAEHLAPDRQRIDYLARHLAAIRDAVAAGSNIGGYYAWSLLDNFEWAQGYARRFGLVHVDFATQRRTIKASGRYYSRVIASHGANLEPTND